MKIILRSYGVDNAWKVPDIDADKAVMGSACTTCNDGYQLTLTAPVAEKNGKAVPGKWLIIGTPIFEVHQHGHYGYIAEIYALFSNISYTISKTASQQSTWTGNGANCRHTTSFQTNTIVADSGQTIYSRCVPLSEFSNCSPGLTAERRNLTYDHTLYTDNVVCIFMPE